jgi:asparagine synthase (glutamine-hydrolysing)
MLNSTHGGPPEGEAWFVAVPDSRRPTLTFGATPLDNAPCALTHPSGAPWIVGSWHPGQLQLVARGDLTIALLGAFQLSPTARRIVEQARSLDDLTKLHDHISGSYHLIACLPGEMRVQGSVSGLRRVFYSTRSQIPVLGSRSDLVAAATSSTDQADVEWLCARLIYPPSPRFLRNGSPWSSVRAVPPEDFAYVREDRQVETKRRWTAPDGTLSITEGADLVRRALESSIEARVKLAGRFLSADLSGGLDSTPLCFLLARSGGELFMLTQAGADAENDDARHAMQAAEFLPGITHKVQQSSDLPGLFANTKTASFGLDEPDSGFRNRLRTAAIGTELRYNSRTFHVGGAGGDEVLQPTPTYLYDLLRDSPRLGYHRARILRARRPLCKRSDLARFLANNETYQDWQRSQLQSLGQPMPRHMLSSWGTPFRVPPWLTREGLALATSYIENNTSITPFHPCRGQHDATESIINAGRVTRLTGQTYGLEGIQAEFPFFDDTVIDAALSVRPEDKADPYSFKPLIRQAMRDLVPSEVMGRSTKADVSREVYAGMRESREDLLDIASSSILNASSLIDSNRLQEAILAPPNPNEHPTMLNETLATQAWLYARSGTRFGVH